MASYIPQIQGANYDITPYQPDLGFLSSVLQTKERQYEKGLSEVASGYSNIINAPVTDYGNIQKKKEYSRSAQEGLKKLAATDLSLSKNVAQAEALYAPFWEDDIMLRDISYTKYANTELGRLNSWKYSNDPEVRKQYSDASRRDIEQGLEDLSMANRDENKYRKLQKRSATVAPDIDGDVDKAWEAEIGKGKENGVSTVTTTRDGAMITEYNGIKSKDAYRTYYLSKVGNKYDEWFKMIARVNTYDDKKSIRINNPYLDEKGVNEHYAADAIAQIGNNYKKIADSYNDQAGYYDKQIGLLVEQARKHQKGVLSAEQASQLAEWKQKADMYKQEGSKYSQEYWNNYSPVTIDDKPNEKYARTFHDIVEYPEQYIANIQKITQAENWAAGRAAITSTKKEVDPLWHEHAFWEDKRVEHELTKRGQDITARGQTLHWGETTGTDIHGNILPGFNPDRAHGWYGKIDNTEASSVANPYSGNYLGQHTVEPAKLPDGVDRIQEAVKQQANSVADQVFNPEVNGITGIVLRQWGMDKNTIIDFSQACKRMMDGTVLKDPKEIAAVEAVKGLLKNHGVGYEMNGPGSLQSAIIDAAGSVSQELRHSPNQDDVERGKQLMAGYTVAEHRRNAYLTTQKNIDKAIKDNILSKPEYNQLTINTPNGKRLISSEDILPIVKSMNLTDRSGNPVNSDELAKAIVSGAVTEEVVRNGQTALVYNGKKVEIPHSYDQFNNNSADDIYRNFVQTYGRPSTFGILRKKANQEAVGSMKQYKDGVIYKEYGYDPNASVKGNNSQENYALNLAPELANPGNTYEFYTYKPGTNEKVALKEGEQVVRNILNSTTSVKSMVGAIVPTTNDEGQDVYMVHMKPEYGTKKDKKDNPYAGQTVYMRVSPNATGEYMRNVPKNTGNYIYGDLYNGGTYRSNKVLNGMGVEYTVRGYKPGPDGRSTVASVYMTLSTPDPDHPGQITKEVIDVDVPMTGPTGKSADEIVNATIGTAINHGNKVVANTKLANSKITKGVHVDDALKMLNGK